MPIETSTSLLSPSMQPSSSASPFAETLSSTPKPFINNVNPLAQTSFSAFVNQFSRPQQNNPLKNTSQNSQNEETSQNTSQNSNQTQTAQTSSSNTSQQKLR